MRVLQVAELKRAMAAQQTEAQLLTRDLRAQLTAVAATSKAEASKAEFQVSQCFLALHALLIALAGRQQHRVCGLIIIVAEAFTDSAGLSAARCLGTSPLSAVGSLTREWCTCQIQV